MRNFTPVILAWAAETDGKRVLQHARILGCDVSAVVTIDQTYFRANLHHAAMKAGKNPALLVRCPTCGAKPGEKCELNTGLPRTEPHPARHFAAEEE